MRQNMEALQRANRYRLLRAEARKEVAALPRVEGCRRMVELFEGEPPPYLASAPLMDVLCWVHRFSGKTVRPVLVIWAMGEKKRLDSLTDRQRQIVRETLTRYVDGDLDARTLRRAAFQVVSDHYAALSG